jgi:hypothetical protein
MFHLRGSREHQSARYADLTRRADMLEASVRRLSDDHTAFQRDYTTKEEWLRECMWSRGRIDQLSALATRVELAMERVSAARAPGDGMPVTAGEADSGEE